MLNGEDEFRALLLVQRPVVNELADELVFACTDDPVGSVYGLLEQFALVFLRIIGIRLCPRQIDFGQQGRSGTSGSLTGERCKVGSNLLGICQVRNNLLVDQVLRSTGFAFTLAVVQHQRHIAKIAHQVEVVECTQELGGIRVVTPCGLVQGHTCHFVYQDVGTVDGQIAVVPCCLDEVVGRCDGKVANLCDVSTVGGSATGVLTLQVVEIDDLIVPGGIHASGGQLLIDAIEGNLYV